MFIQISRSVNEKSHFSIVMTECIYRKKASLELQKLFHQFVANYASTKNKSVVSREVAPNCTAVTTQAALSFTSIRSTSPISKQQAKLNGDASGFHCRAGTQQNQTKGSSLKKGQRRLTERVWEKRGETKKERKI